MTSFSSPTRPALPLLLLLISALAAVLLSAGPSSAATELVNQVCGGTGDPRFCAAALYSDPRTPTADAYSLAYVAFGLAYLNATRTGDHISRILSSPSLAHRSPALAGGLQSCRRGYAAAVTKLAAAYNDLNSETFADLAGYAGSAARAAGDCDGAFGGSPYAPLVAGRNRDLRRLCEICAAVSKLFT
ncbi:cell wall / vacuolar inhibitor of fructosidase 2-like [Eucalyptus grandis]|uniref:cell wall / vacuolar inhibitor of fructosidase 2-like n=1 Tax=Eucalyptus grandis TaxID=71139 RepID=UPI00192E8820|nr:cell wall / vacuolar inhibitor of fructosidase 2-like [Eucalyptus grandis]